MHDIHSSKQEKDMSKRRPIILYRQALMDEKELVAASDHFVCTKNRTLVSYGDLVVSRYSCLPFYRELDDDLGCVGATLINSFHEHCYVADMWNWVDDLEGLTPKTWRRLADVDEPGPYVLKGKTNSRKHDWNTHMFAIDKQAAGEVEWRLLKDGLIGEGNQDIMVRKYVPLVTHGYGLNGLPITREFRFFCIDGRVLCGGFYWAGYEDIIDCSIPSPDEVPRAFLDDVLSRIGKRVRFVVVDVALAQDGRWIVVELNDGQMSGLSCCDPIVMYGDLARSLAIE